MKITEHFRFRTQANSRAGFTMVELVLTMGIASILSMALLELARTNSKSNQETTGSIMWNSVLAEITLILNTPSTCQAVFSSFYPTGGSAPSPYVPGTGTTSLAFLPTKPLVIPRPGSPNPYQAGYVEKGSAGGSGIRIVTIEATGATNLTSNVVQLNVHIQAQKSLASTSTQSQYDKTIPIMITRSLSPNSCPGGNCRFNAIQNCTSDYSGLVAQDACESLGGVWTTAPAGGEPNCKYIRSDRTPPAYTPLLANTAAYFNLCPVGQVISGIDLSTGKALAACTNATPISNSIPTCTGGVLTWQQNASPSQGRYVCKPMPGAVAGTNVPTGTVVTPSCGSTQHLYWDGNNFTCTDDARPSAAPACPKWQIPVWNGTGWTCRPIIPNPSTNGPGDCKGNKFLQWDATSASYRCGPLAPIPACSSTQILSWNGTAFQCAHLDPTSSKSIVDNCSSPSRIYFDANNHKFICGSAQSIPPIPTMDCSANGMVLQYNGSGYTCVPLEPINYDYCTTVSTGQGGMVECPWGMVGVGFCSSGEDPDCSESTAPSKYVQSYTKEYTQLKCCSLSAGRYLVRASSWATGIAGGGANSNSFSNKGNLATCNNSSALVIGICSGDDDSKCAGAHVAVNCAWAGGLTFNNSTYHSGSSTGSGYGVTSMTHNGCRIVNGRSKGEWAHCATNEVLAGICASGSLADCGWATKGNDSYNQALCCPVR